ncbi:MAG: RNA-binding protein [Ruminococcus sp.]|nr:RNA-binding protein [Ruminococcus sp.]
MDSSSDKFFYARLGDMVSLTEKNGVCSFSDFLDERQCAETEKWCIHNTGGLMYTFWGGFPDASRRMLAVYPDYYEDYIMEDFPLVCLTFTYRKEDRLTHRDFLGTFMGMRLRRDVIGDIVVGEGITQAFVTDVAGKLISTIISKIGRTGVKCFTDRPFEMEVKQEFRTLSGTVASLRLDCVVSFATGLSREKSALLIRSDKVEVNHFQAKSVSAEVRTNDVLSIRGFGKFILSGTDGLTRKNRIHITLKKFV